MVCVGVWFCQLSCRCIDRVGKLSRLPKNLTSRQQAFIDEYLQNGQNGAAAYRKAYNAKVSSSTCSVKAHRLGPIVSLRVTDQLRLMTPLPFSCRFHAAEICSPKLGQALPAASSSPTRRRFLANDLDHRNHRPAELR
jgi:hypothetical protein